MTHNVLHSDTHVEFKRRHPSLIAVGMYGCMATVGTTTETVWEDDDFT
jgi:hypothetical protein